MRVEQQRRIENSADKTELFTFGDGDKRIILAGATDTAEADVLLPVLQHLSLDSTVYFMVDGSAKKRLQQSSILMEKVKTTGSPLLDMSNILADVVVTGKASVPATEYAMTSNARLNGTPIVWVEDYPGNIFPHYSEIGLPSKIFPDYFCVVTEEAKETELVYGRMLDPNKVIVTGQPAFDYIAVENQEEIRTETRKRLGINASEKLLTYIGGKDFVTVYTLHALVEQIERLEDRNLRLVVRNHPGNSWLTKSQIAEIVEPIQDRVIDTDLLKFANEIHQIRYN